MSALLDAVGALDSRWLLALLLVVLDVWAVGLVLASGARRREKILWSGVLILCPIIGCLFWYVLGPKPRLVE